MKFAGVQKFIRRMTNWQRNQWAKAKYPIDKIEFYTKLKKENK